jgi:lipopolysaccharide export LptBFGC system permease protein LptF
MYSSPKPNIYVPKWNYNLDTIIERLDKWMNEDDTIYKFKIEGNQIIIYNKSKYIYARIDNSLQYKMNEKYDANNTNNAEFNELQYVNSLLYRILSTF